MKTAITIIVLIIISIFGIGAAICGYSEQAWRNKGFPETRKKK